MSEDTLLSRRQILGLFGGGVGAAIIGSTSAQTDTQADGNLYGGINGMAQSYQVGEGMYKGPLSTRSEVPKEDGNTFIATDAGNNGNKFEFYHYNGGWAAQGWDLPSLNTEDLHTKEEPWHDVTEYGAAGDGSTDDTSAIQSALDTAESAGGATVYLPRGTYLISSTLRIGDYVRIKGAGINTTTIKLADGSNTDGIRPKNDSPSDPLQQGVEVKDLSLNGNKANNQSGDHDSASKGFTGIRFINTEDAVAERVKGYNWWGYAIEVKISIGTRLSKCIGYGAGDDNFSVSDRGYSSTTEEVTISECRGYSADGTYNPGAGFEVDDGPRGVTIVGCTAKNNYGDGFNAHTSSGDDITRGVTFNGCVSINNGRDGFSLNASGEVTAQDCQVDGCISRQDSRYGFIIGNPSENMTISDSKAFESGTNGVRIDANTANVSGGISDPTIENVTVDGRGVTDYAAKISGSNPLERPKISGGVFKNAATHGVQFQSGGATDGTVTGLNVHSNSGRGIDVRNHGGHLKVRECEVKTGSGQNVGIAHDGSSSTATVIKNNDLRNAGDTVVYNPDNVLVVDNEGYYNALASPPATTIEGEEYLDDGTNRGDGNVGYRKYDGAAWVDIAG